MNNTYIKGRITKGEFVSQLFKQRVESIGGTYEANDCLVNSLNSLTDKEFKDAKLILTPNGYVVDKLPTIKPNGGGDATVTRNTTKTRVNSSGLIESMPANVLAPDYLNGVCPALNVEGQATNLFKYSEQFDDAAWSKVGTSAASAPVVTVNDAISPSGSITADRVFFDTVGSTSSDRSILRQFLTVSNVNYNQSFYVKSGNNTPLTLAFHYKGGTPLIFNVTTEWTRFNYSDLGLDGSSFFGIEARGDRTTNQANVHIWGAQFKEGIEPSSYIPTTTAQITRSADSVTIPIPSGTTEIIEKYEDDTTNTITTIPASPYTVPTGKRYEYILMR